MKYKCCNCKNVFADQDVSFEPKDSNKGNVTCPSCKTGLQKSSSKESNIKGINFVIATFVLGVIGNSVWGDAYHEATEMSWLVASFGLFVFSIIVVILLNINNKDLFISHTEVSGGISEVSDDEK